QFDEVDSILAGAAPKAAPGSKENRCGTGCIGAEVRSKPPSEPTPEPKPISSIAGISARGTMDAPSTGTAPGDMLTASASAGSVPKVDPGDPPEGCPADPAPAPAAAAKLAIGRAPISAWRIASRVKSCTNCERRKRTSIFAGCTLTSTSSYGISKN